MVLTKKGGVNMKKTVSFVLVVIAVTLVGYGVSRAAEPPHTDYRTGYGSSCFSGTGACHDVAKGTFLDHAYDRTAQTDYTDFCLSCHNASGEAHERSAGSAATEGYVNFTGLDKSVPYSGNSHSWNGVIGNAGTVVPTLMGGTTHMPNGDRVTCQVCHQGMDKTAEENIDWSGCTDSGDGLNFTIDSATGSTKQYLAKYLRVYRASVFTTRPINTRTKKTYLVDPSEYTYDYATATITFSTSQTGKFIYADIGQPYFRDGNAGNALCLNCHPDRQDTTVNHPGDPAAKDQHPVTITYGHASGLNDTLKPSPDANIYIEGTQVLCTSCHDPHNAASDDGALARSADASDLCTDCHKVNGYDGYTASLALVANHNGGKHTSATKCLDCHTTHGTDNALLVKNRINGKAVSFLNFTGPNSFGNDSGSSVCEACHTTTKYHLSDGTGTGHHTGENCTAVCHTHSSGFQPSGDCSSCHGYPPDSSGLFCWNDTTGDAHLSHMTHLNAAQFGNLTNDDACKQCHGATIPRADHSFATDCTGKDSAGVDTATWTTWTGVGGNYGGVIFDEGTTIGKVNTSDDTCTNVSCHSGAGTRKWGGTPDCNGCHSYPVAGSNWTGTNGHTVQYDGLTAHLPATGYNEKTDDYVTMTTDPTRCGKCHYNTLGDLTNHKNGTINMTPKGYPACPPDLDFTITVNASGSSVTCTNVKCHTANTTTPNWW